MSQGTRLFELTHDVQRFILFNRGVIENAPLQAYHSALIFSPSHSLTRYLFKNEEPQWVTAKSAIGSTWGACLQTLEGHNDWVNSVVFSPDGSRIASGSYDNTVRIWDAVNGDSLCTLEGHSSSVNSVAFSPDGSRIASGSDDKTVRIWDAGNGDCLHTLQGHSASTESDPATLGVIAWGSTSNAQKMRETPQRYTYDLNTSGTWITSNSQNVIWLPPEYRPSIFALTSSTMVIGCISGRVLIFDFSNKASV